MSHSYRDIESYQYDVEDQITKEQDEEIMKKKERQVKHTLKLNEAKCSKKSL